MGTINAIQGTKDALLEADEVTGGWVAKIGNSLQEQGVVDEDSYDWMHEQPEYRATLGQGLLSKLENVQEFVEKVNTIVSTGVEIQENTNELIENSQNLKESLDAFKTEKTEQEQADKETSKAPEVVEVSELLEPASEEDTK